MKSPWINRKEHREPREGVMTWALKDSKQAEEGIPSTERIRTMEHNARFVFRE